MIEDYIGETPLIEIEDGKVKIFAKAEFLNPGGSVKDRVALSIFMDLESKDNQREKILLDSTSGNTGIGYAMIAASKGYKIELVVPANVSPIKRRIMESYGARLILTDPEEGSEGAERMAERLYLENREKYIYLNQYKNRANFFAHFHKTGKEILSQTKGKITHFVAPFGTGGTVFGVGKRFKVTKPDVKIFCVQPDEEFHGIEGLRSIDPKESGFYEEGIIESILYVRTEEAFDMCRWLAKRKGILVGPSSGACLAAALKLKEGLERGFIVTLFPDRGERYDHLL